MSMSTSLIDDLSGIARSAGRLALDARTRGLREWIKHENELVTSAELQIHGHVLAELSRLLPGLSVLTVESQEHAIPRDRFIVVDEIDGTTPFAAGADTWGVMIALIEDEPTSAVIHLPQKNVTITAQRQQGCWIDGRRVSFRFGGSLRDAVAGADIAASLDDSGWLLIRKIAGRARALRCFGCAAAGALEHLEGITQLYVNPAGGKIWDFAPIALAVREAGGTASTAGGAPLQWNRLEMSFLACATMALAEEVLAL
jgi:fructose-1,6-bisphosphatase/inositol monophosphatase family enzyme